MTKQKDNAIDHARAKLLALIQRLLEPVDKIIVNLIETKPSVYDDAKALAQQLGKHEPIFYYHEPGADGNIANGDLVVGVNAYDEVNAKRQAVHVRNGNVVVGADTIGDNQHPFRGNGDGGNALLWRDLATWVAPLAGNLPDYARDPIPAAGTFTPVIVGALATRCERPDYIPEPYRTIAADDAEPDVSAWWTARQAADNRGVDAATIRRAGNRKEITRAKVNGRGRDRWRFDPASVRRWQPQKPDSGTDPKQDDIRTRAAAERAASIAKKARAYCAIASRL